MNAYKLFPVTSMTIPGANWGWHPSQAEVTRGMPLRIEAFGSIKFGWFDSDLTPDGNRGRLHDRRSLGYPELEAQGIHAPFGCLLGRVAHSVFVVGSFREMRAPATGMLSFGHNDTPEWQDNDGTWTVYVYLPVERVTGVRQGNALNVHFDSPAYGINGQLGVNLPQWMVNPNPKVTFHDGQQHGINPKTGLLCTRVEKEIFGHNFGLCVHIQA